MMSSFHVAGRSVDTLAGRDICNDSSVNNCTAIVDARIIYSVVITTVFVIGLIISGYLIMRQRRAWRRKQDLGLIFIPPPAAPSDPPYDPSVGRPVHNTGPKTPQPANVPPPPAYSAV